MCRGFRLDFFLVSQSVNQGTVSPTHYNILRHGGRPTDQLQMYTYKMCHLYYNWAVSTRLVVCLPTSTHRTVCEMRAVSCMYISQPRM